MRLRQTSHDCDAGENVWRWRRADGRIAQVCYRGVSSQLLASTGERDFGACYQLDSTRGMPRERTCARRIQPLKEGSASLIRERIHARCVQPLKEGSASLIRERIYARRVQPLKEGSASFCFRSAPIEQRAGVQRVSILWRLPRRHRCKPVRRVRT